MNRTEIDDRIGDALLFVDTLGDDDAAYLARAIIDQIIDALRADAAVPWRSFDDWSLRLADLRQRIEDNIASIIDGFGDVDAAVDAIVDELAEDDEGGRVMHDGPTSNDNLAPAAIEYELESVGTSAESVRKQIELLLYVIRVAATEIELLRGGDLIPADLELHVDGVAALLIGEPNANTYRWRAAP